MASSVGAGALETGAVLVMQDLADLQRASHGTIPSAV